MTLDPLPQDEQRPTVDTRLGDLFAWAAALLARHGFGRRIDLYRRVRVDDGASRALGRPHWVLVRLRLTAESLLFRGEDAGAGKGQGEGEEKKTAP
jgi:hypothetical protein